MNTPTYKTAIINSSMLVLDFVSFLNMLVKEYNIRAITTGATPLKNPSKILDDEFLKYRYDKTKTIQNDGKAEPKVHIRTPGIP